VAIESGQQLLHYRLTEKIGEGGMGVVWLATDTELDRDVAIKVLPAGFEADADRLARFEREAKLLASLSHPNVAAVHGLHTDAGVRFLAMEYVEGEDLAARIERGPLPVDEALEIAKQIADGLELAHRNDVIHRDLKPANIRLTTEGTVKILDFGLAKALGTDAQGMESDSTQSPTVTSFGTVAGVILGTASYMSPEQARGKAVDRRADLWAFGCVLYEMLAGRRPFAGETVTDTLAAVMRAEPDWSALPSAVPVRVRQLLRRCLQKSPNARLRDAGDAGLELLDAQAGVPVESDAGAATSRSSVPIWVPALLLAALVIVVVAFVTQSGKREPVGRGKRQFHLDVTEGMRSWAPAISRDGLLLANVVIPSDPKKSPELHVQRLDTGEVRRLDTGDWVPRHLSFSPDGKWVAYTDWGKLMKARVDGGPPVEVAQVFFIRSPPAWGDDDTIVFANWGGGLSRVPAAGGEVQALTRLDPEGSDTGRAGVSGHGQPAWSPDGRAVLFHSSTGIDRVDVTTGEREQLLDVSALAIGVAAGRLLWVESGGGNRRGALFAIEIEDDGRLRESSPTLIAEEIRRFSVSKEGTLILASTDSPPIVPVWVDREGNETEIPTVPVLARPSISPDGTRIAGHTSDQIHVYDIERETTTSLMPDPELEVGATWSPDGRQIYFWRVSGSTLPSRYRIASDGSGEPVELREEEGWLFVQSKDEQIRMIIEFLKKDLEGGMAAEIRFLNEEGKSLHPPLLVDGSTFDISPHGRRFAYTAGDGADRDVYVFDVESGNRWNVGRGRAPRWSHDGGELFYRLGQALVAVPVTTSGPGRVETLFWISSPNMGKDGFYAVHPDGERFFMQRWVSESEATASNRLTVVLDWTEPASK
jgi:serine/threonine protein kinase